MNRDLEYRSKNSYDCFSGEETALMEEYCERYKAFISNAKTEREVVNGFIKIAEEKGFVEYEPGMKLAAGDRVYHNNRGKSLILAVIGKRSMSEGCRIAAAHCDSPRLDVKPNPLCEIEEFGMLRTHYYGGIKKYQWTAIPLALHGVICLKDGTVKEVRIGEKAGDPVFCVPDLLPHLSREQMQKKMSEGITGEGLKVVFASRPVSEEDDGKISSRVKYSALEILNSEYGITEEDFVSAELEFVPAWQAADAGVDRSMIAAYGQDDRVCAYGEFEAIIGLDTPDRTCICMAADKEEIGSVGVTGMQSMAFDAFIEDLCESTGGVYRRCIENSVCLSADVVNAVDPVFTDVSELQNSARFNHGVAIAKYSGSAGKSGCSDASAELVGWFRKVFDDKNVVWQMTELGKVDQGGGGTVAGHVARRNIDTLDVGVSLLSMHAPLELSSKADCYMMNRAVDAFYRAEE